MGKYRDSLWFLLLSSSFENFCKSVFLKNTGIISSNKSHIETKQSVLLKEEREESYNLLALDPFPGESLKCLCWSMVWEQQHLVQLPQLIDSRALSKHHGVRVDSSHPIADLFIEVLTFLHKPLFTCPGRDLPVYTLTSPLPLLLVPENLVNMLFIFWFVVLICRIFYHGTNHSFHFNKGCFLKRKWCRGNRSTTQKKSQ